MVGVFIRKPNGDGTLQWRCRSVGQGKVPRLFVARFRAVTTVIVNIKRAPSVGKFCRAPAHYM